MGINFRKIDWWTVMCVLVVAGMSIYTIFGFINTERITEDSTRSQLAQNIIVNHTITNCGATKLDEPVDISWAGVVKSTGTPINADDNLWTYVLKKEPKNKELPDEQIFNYFMTCCEPLEKMKVFEMGKSMILIQGKWVGYVNTENIPYLSGVAEYNNGCIPVVQVEEAYLLEENNI